MRAVIAVIAAIVNALTLGVGQLQRALRRLLP